MTQFSFGTASCKHSAVFFFADADVLIHCGNTVFQVHSKLLSAESTVLKQLIILADLTGESRVNGSWPRSCNVESLGNSAIAPMAAYNPAHGTFVRKLKLLDSPTDLNLLFALLYPHIPSLIHSENVEAALDISLRYNIASIQTLCLTYLDIRAALFKPLLALRLCTIFQARLPALRTIFADSVKTVLDDIPRYSSDPLWCTLPASLRERLRAKWHLYTDEFDRVSQNPFLLLQIKYAHDLECPSSFNCEARSHVCLRYAWFTLVTSTQSILRVQQLNRSMPAKGPYMDSFHYHGDELRGIPRPSEIARFFTNVPEDLKLGNNGKQNPCLGAVKHAMEMVLEKRVCIGASCNFRWLSFDETDIQDVEREFGFGQEDF